eukprot:CAMPEP_0118995220 /NCGR_PEP_ID=MMETSP1173-20130426/58120_1 /TAXON_ID=1034831 /ORGANISM="Rhizochromulina marina cf, Strain CCMP1243" /LENGTH=47 /DNA_ID= /DNA_START= /DNA_END= /DNA_ORIENTATION=
MGAALVWMWVVTRCSKWARSSVAVDGHDESTRQRSRARVRRTLQRTG